MQLALPWRRRSVAADPAVRRASIDDASAAPSPASTRLYWACQIGGWGAYTATKVWAAFFFLPLPPLPTIIAALILGGAGLGATHALRGYIHRHSWRTLPRSQLAVRIVAAGLVLGLPFGIATFLTPLAAMQDPGFVAGAPTVTTAGPGIVLLLNYVNAAFLFILWQALYFVVLAVRQYRSAELRESELARALHLAELRLLKSQLNPHFLFNALNTVRSLIAHDPARAQDAVTRLANTLRYTLSSAQDELVTLAQELEIVQDYLDLESLRLEDRLTIDCAVSAEARAARIPVMLLQTVVENAVKHGIAELPAGGVLRIHGDIRAGELVIDVENPRPAAAPRSSSEGIGLRNAAERLRLLFGEGARLDVDLSRPTLALARVRIPARA
jgi:hypothetical protein